MRDKLLRRIRAEALLLPGDTVYCALSGGTDSVALTHLLCALAEELQIAVRVCHFNHRLRGAASDADEAFCREFAARLGLSIEVGGADVAAYAKAHGQSLEEAARSCRYAFFETLDGKIATAHTADDQLETVLMNLLRGTGLKGLGGIPPKREKHIRPLLDVTRAETEAYLLAHGLEHREDASNAEDDCVRNRLRHHVTPLLRAENPNWQACLSRMTALLREDEALLQGLSDALLIRAEDGGWEVKPLREAEKPLRERALRTLLRRCAIPKLTAAHILSAEALLDGSAGTAEAHLPGGWIVKRRYERLYLERETPASFSPVTLTAPGKVCLPELSMYLAIDEAADGIPVGASHLDGGITVRPPEPGDRLRLPGGTKALRRILTDRKIPADRRTLVPVIACGETVLAVYGVGGNRDCLPRDGEKTFYIRFEEREEEREA